ncbi:MAG: PilZ domain-containing protein [Gammaproteobacteria bacterium]
MEHITDQERRTHNRIVFDAPVVISDATRQWRSSLLDISLKGALLARPDDWDAPTRAGTPLQLDIQLSGSELHIRMQGTLMHVEEHHMGFHCDHIDLDSITNLRHLLELNLADESLLQRELSSFLY